MTHDPPRTHPHLAAACPAGPLPSPAEATGTRGRVREWVRVAARAAPAGRAGRERASPDLSAGGGAGAEPLLGRCQRDRGRSAPRFSPAGRDRRDRPRRRWLCNWGGSGGPAPPPVPREEGLPLGAPVAAFPEQGAHRIPKTSKFGQYAVSARRCGANRQPRAAGGAVCGQQLLRNTALFPPSWRQKAIPAMGIFSLIYFCWGGCDSYLTLGKFH
ncbi:uncharacterized protein LOC121341717 [Onychostruthus taczanowskii]|uniref:uncharacterized protein LOC121341717 n=1 Tax=Onychostruthus taczanowskii TaxID=356909 RepID=UPI001B80260D|nr:uncharacterized protein LOC121341717 [Onychostruthus taczanowskii]